MTILSKVSEGRSCLAEAPVHEAPRYLRLQDAGPTIDRIAMDGVTTAHEASELARYRRDNLLSVAAENRLQQALALPRVQPSATHRLSSHTVAEFGDRVGGKGFGNLLQLLLMFERIRSGGVER